MTDIFYDGDKVKLKPEYEENKNEIFTVTESDEQRKCWIADEDGRGWYCYFDQLDKI
tara:strand:+ start:858 stop:1028 length:171 start_codon:yes stop_codon:yes gene_type:complete